MWREEGGRSKNAELYGTGPDALQQAPHPNLYIQTHMVQVAHARLCLPRPLFVRKRESFSYVALLRQIQSTRTYFQAAVCRMCTPQSPLTFTAWQAQVEPASAAALSEVSLRQTSTESFGTHLGCFVHSRTSTNDLRTSAHGMPDVALAMFRAPGRSLRIRPSCSAASGTGTGQSSTGTSSTVSAGALTTSRPAKSKAASKSTNKPATAARKTAKSTSKGNTSTTQTSQATASDVLKQQLQTPPVLRLTSQQLQATPTSC